MNKQTKKLIKINDENYWGHCLNEEHENFYKNIGNENWYYCPICKIKWLVGIGLFAKNLTTKKESEENFNFLKDFKEVKEKEKIYERK